MNYRRYSLEVRLNEMKIGNHLITYFSFHSCARKPKSRESHSSPLPQVFTAGEG
jgi:hypothetical protein